MSRGKKYTPEQIIVKLREVEILCGKGQTVGEAVRQIGVTEQTYYRWRKEYGNMNTQQAISSDFPISPKRPWLD